MENQLNEIKRMQELAGINIINEEKEGYVITNGIEWYAGSKDYLAFAKSKIESNLYKTYEDAIFALKNEIDPKVINEKELVISKY